NFSARGSISRLTNSRTDSRNMAWSEVYTDPNMWTCLWGRRGSYSTVTHPALTSPVGTSAGPRIPVPQAGAAPGRKRPGQRRYADERQVSRRRTKRVASGQDHDRLDGDPLLAVLGGLVDLVELVVGDQLRQRELVLLDQLDQPRDEDVRHAVALDDAD